MNSSLVRPCVVCLCVCVVGTAAVWTWTPQSNRVGPTRSSGEGVQRCERWVDESTWCSARTGHTWGSRSSGAALESVQHLHRQGWREGHKQVKKPYVSECGFVWGTQHMASRKSAPACGIPCGCKARGPGRAGQLLAYGETTALARRFEVEDWKCIPVFMGALYFRAGGGLCQAGARGQ